MSFTSITVTGTFKEPDNTTAARGHVDFQLTNDMADGTGGRVLARTKKRATLDSSGHFSITLAATDDLTTTPEGTQYLVTESIVGAPTRTFYMELPLAVASVDIASAEPQAPNITFVEGPEGPTGPPGPASGPLGSESVTNAHVATNAAIDRSKIAGLDDAYASAITPGTPMVAAEKVPGEIYVRGLAVDGSNTAGNTTKLNAAITAAATGTTLTLPEGNISFSALTDVGTKIVTLRGVGYQTNVAAAFGDAQWGVAASFKGTVLRPTTTTGNALAATGAFGLINLENLCVIGPGSGTSVGVQLGHRTDTGTVRAKWSNVMVANFYKPVSWAAMLSQADRLVILGGGVAGLEFVSSGNANLFNNLEVTSCAGRAVDMSAGTLNQFNCPTLQGNTGTVIYANGSHGSQWHSAYLENAGATFAIDIVAGADYHQFYDLHVSAAGNAVRIAGNHCAILLPQTPGVVTVSGTSFVGIGSFNGSLSGTGLTAGNGAVVLDSDFGTALLGNQDIRISSGKRLYLETTGMGSFIGRDPGTGDTEIGSGSGLTRLAGNLGAASLLLGGASSGPQLAQLVVGGSIGHRITLAAGATGNPFEVKDDLGGTIFALGAVGDAVLGGSVFLRSNASSFYFGTADDCRLYRLGASALKTDGSLQVRSGASQGVGLFVQPSDGGHIGAWFVAHGSQSEDILAVTSSGFTPYSRFNKAGYFMTRKVTAPADADIATGEMALWFDSTNGAAKLMVKAKQADGTVRTGSLALT